MSWFDDVGSEIDPNWGAGGYTGGYTGDNPPPYLAQAGGQAPQAGQWAANNQGFLDWATKTFGADANSFVKIPPGQLQQILQRYTAETGNQAKFMGGPSGDRVDFGQGVQDALTSSGQIWNDERTGAGGPQGVRPGGAGGGSAGRGAPVAWGGGGGANGQMRSGGGGGQNPAALAFDKFQAPGNVPQLERLGYTPMQAPGNLTAQQVGVPGALTYTNAQTPTAFAGSRQATPGTLSYQHLATPANFQYEKYTAPTAAELQADPSYQFRLKQGQDVLEGSAASKGTLRTGNTAKALLDYGQGAASQEYQNVFNRGLATSQANNAGRLGEYQTNAQTGLAYNQNANQNALNFGQANIQNRFAANEANYGRSSNEAQQAFQNANLVNQQNNAGNFQVGQANISNALNAAQANNQANLAYGAQNFNQGFATNQANNQGQFQAMQANNQNALAQQGQQFGQSLAGYQANQAAQNQAAQQALGWGNLDLGYQNSANSYALGQGNLGLGYGQLDLSRSNAEWGQGLDTYDRNYRANVTDPWQQQYQLAALGNPGAPNGQGYANAAGDLLTQQGNAQAAGTVGAANQWNQAAGSLGQTAQQLAYMRWLQSQSQAKQRGGYQ